MESMTKGTTEACEHFHETNKKIRRFLTKIATGIMNVVIGLIALILLCVSALVIYLIGEILILSAFALFGDPNPWKMTGPWIPLTRGQGILDILLLILIFSVVGITLVGGLKYWVGMAQYISGLFKKNKIQGENH